FFLAGRTVVRGTVGLLGVVRLDGGQGDAGLGQGVLESHPAQQGGAYAERGHAQHARTVRAVWFEHHGPCE
ncbi:MAG: hypothetical protein ACFNLE_03590, partial [Rothia aeria]